MNLISFSKLFSLFFTFKCGFLNIFISLLELEKSSIERENAQTLASENSTLKSELERQKNTLISVQKNFDEKSKSVSKVMEENLRLKKERTRAEIMRAEKSQSYQDRIKNFISDSRKILKTQKSEAENNFKQLNQSYRISTANIVEKYQSLIEENEQKNKLELTNAYRTHSAEIEELRNSHEIELISKDSKIKDLETVLENIETSKSTEKTRLNEEIKCLQNTISDSQLTEKSLREKFLAKNSQSERLANELDVTKDINKHLRKDFEEVKAENV